MSLADCCLTCLHIEAVGYGLYWPPKISLANLLSGNMSLADCCLTCLYTEAVGYGLHWPLIISLANLLSGNMSLADCCLTCPFQVPCSLASTSLGLADGLFRLLLHIRPCFLSIRTVALFIRILFTYLMALRFPISVFFVGHFLWYF